MLVQTQSGFPLTRTASGTYPNAPGGVFGEMLESRLLPDYYSLVKAGLVFSLGGLAANPAAFTGGAAGTPLLGIYNPQGSARDIVLLEVAIGLRTTGTAAVALDFNHFGAAQGTTLITGTQTQATNLYSLQAQGSVVRGMVNVANTAALASTLLRPSISVGLTGVAGAPNVQRLVDELKGGIVIPPGGYYALGASAAPTAASIDFAALWAEIPA